MPAPRIGQANAQLRIEIEELRVFFVGLEPSAPNRLIGQFGRHDVGLTGKHETPFDTATIAAVPLEESQPAAQRKITHVFGFQIEEQKTVQRLAIGAILIDAAHRSFEPYAGLAAMRNFRDFIEPAIDFTFVYLLHVGQFFDSGWGSGPVIADTYWPVRQHARQGWGKNIGTEDVEFFPGKRPFEGK